MIVRKVVKEALIKHYISKGNDFRLYGDDENKVITCLTQCVKNSHFT